MNRRNFLTSGVLGSAGMLMGGEIHAHTLDVVRRNPKIKPIAGSWFEFQHLLKEEGLYIGIMNKPDSKAFAGHKDSIRLYQQYKNWLNH